MTGQRAAGGFDLTRGDARRLERLQAEGAEVQRGAALGQAGPAAALVIITQPASSARYRKDFNPQPVIGLADAFGNPVATGGVTVTATLNSGLGTLRGDRTRNTNSQGVATFVDLNISGLGTFTIQFSAPGVTSVVSAQITVSP